MIIRSMVELSPEIKAALEVVTITRKVQLSGQEYRAGESIITFEGQRYGILRLECTNWLAENELPRFDAWLVPMP